MPCCSWNADPNLKTIRLVSTTEWQQMCTFSEPGRVNKKASAYKDAEVLVAMLKAGKKHSRLYCNDIDAPRDPVPQMAMQAPAAYPVPQIAMQAEHTNVDELKEPVAK